MEQNKQNLIAHKISDKKFGWKLIFLGIIISFMMAPTLFSDVSGHINRESVEENVPETAIQPVKQLQDQDIERNTASKMHYNFLAMYLLKESESTKKENDDNAPDPFGKSIYGLLQKIKIDFKPL